MNKIIHKLRYVLFTFLVVCVGFASTINAAPSSIVVSSSGRLSYIGDTFFPAKYTSSGDVAYCMDFYKEMPMNTSMNLAGTADVGLTYIIQNGYPAKSITGDGNQDMFITSAAVWWYLDDTRGTSNLTYGFKTSASDPNGLRPHIQALVNAAKNAKTAANASLTVSMSDKTMKLTSDKKYYESNLATVSATGVSSYNVSVTDAPSGTVVVDASGNAKSNFAPSEKFKVRIPASSFTDLKTKARVNITASSTTYKVYTYTPNDGRYQSMIIAKQYPETKNLSTSLTVLATRTKVSISKQDITNKKELPGAKLTVKDSAGKVIASWTSTDKPYYIENLPEGKYTLTEEIAPKGYDLSKEKITFMVKADGQVQNVVMYNTPTKVVPNITRVSISKQDLTTKMELPGAKLTIRDSNGKIIATWISTDAPHYIEGLKPGTYTLEEEYAPDGYELNKEKIKFTIKDDGKLVSVVMYNAKKPDVVIEVPKTASTISMIIYIVGFMAVAGGSGYVYYHAKANK